MLKYEKDYLELCQRILNEGVWVENKRTGRKCLTLIGETLKYDVGAGDVPLLTTKQSFPVSAVAEILGYLRKYTNAQDFADIGSPTWFVNANETQAWLNNKNRKGDNDIGIIYGAAQHTGELEKIYNNLKNGIDDRGETIDFWKPEKFHLGCLRACMRTHTFSIVGDTLHMVSESRSVDTACGLNFNSIQCYFLLSVMAQITGLKAGVVTHNMVNVHLYDSHIEGIKEQLSRTPLDIIPSLKVKGWVVDLQDITESNLHAREYIRVEDYEHLGKIPFDLVA